MTVHPSIFREYDIRGIVDAQLTEEAVYEIGRAFATQAAAEGRKKITIGRDCRESSPRLFDALAKGVIWGGLDVLDVGVVATPMQYFSILHFGVDGGVQITGSHNPPEYNGLKLSLGTSTLHGSQIQALRKRIEDKELVQGSAHGTVRAADVVGPYVQYCAQNIQLGPRKLKVVVDAGNGTGGPFALEILKRLGVDVVPLYCEMDGTFPNHHPDPTVEENLRDLIARVKGDRADVGIAYDGDADRVGAVDENGNVLWGDQLMILFSREVLKEKPGAVIVAEVKCSKTLYDDIARHGGKGVMWKAGHSLIKDKMKETHAELAGEMSGHIFFKNRYFGFDDGIYASLRLLELLSHADRPLSKLLSDVPRMYSTPEIRVDCPEEMKFKLVAAVTEHFKKKKYEVIDVDGARVTFSDGWGLIRASNTQPILVMRFEAETKERLDAIRRLIEEDLALVRSRL